MRQRRRITSIKPGRGPSFMGGIGSIAAVIFGVFWTITASRMANPFGGAVSFFPVFGVVFILLGIASAVYNFRNATGKERYSMVDITDSETEPDPLNEIFGRSDGDSRSTDTAEPDAHEEKDLPDGQLDSAVQRQPDAMNFCPYCGYRLRQDYSYCPECGKKLDDA